MTLSWGRGFWLASKLSCCWVRFSLTHFHHSFSMKDCSAFWKLEKSFLLFRNTWRCWREEARSDKGRRNGEENFSRGNQVNHLQKITSRSCRLFRAFNRYMALVKKHVIQFFLHVRMISELNSSIFHFSFSLLGIFWKCARIGKCRLAVFCWQFPQKSSPSETFPFSGERKSPYVAVCCILMAFSVLFWIWHAPVLSSFCDSLPSVGHLPLFSSSSSSCFTAWPERA